MPLNHVLRLYTIMDDPRVSGEKVAAYLKEVSPHADVDISRVDGEKGSTDFIKVHVRGRHGRSAGGSAPTMGIIGRLGGIGARPERTGFVSDGDGALAAMSAAAKLLDMQERGDFLDGDVILTTHICGNAPTQPHDPVPFMGSPVDILTMNHYEVDPAMEAILSIDTTKGNQITNHKGIAVTPTVKEGYVLRVSEDLLFLYSQSTGILPVTLPITTQDITPYGNGVYHINSILQPAVATQSPVVGVAITAQAAVAGCATGATHLEDVEQAARFSIETAKAYGEGNCQFYNEEEFALLEKLYGKMTHLQTLGKEAAVK
ncbi:DUF1177 domain-containing protein [Shouchella clausii]|jgi:hypothetical protein|uniref:DUF1177 domain-containing protein n=1 Tax=Shouchella clausii TaxID=79880 RepID=UPI0007966DBB|nr:DUF1177 domain-containing protein [Shouchella clausii]MCM3314486.1 DUF1177 domain-containing protein [Psychrobacillus sp. MER TA 17]KKI86788.1 hypothetical protein WZ76_07565 [Shouchella clausii]MDO7269054.1 DUF1177 domain-containing protein [Shouchella clausii]MDO7288729.1 DUF1177 domain-containing protein [Shouchella clausii]PAE92312.1 DUF1177 domain-containing protein [Shouchella clausii]